MSHRHHDAAFAGIGRAGMRRVAQRAPLSAMQVTGIDTTSARHRACAQEDGS